MISQYISGPWPKEVKEAVESFRQGDLIERPPFFYGHGGDVRLWDVGAPDDPPAEESATKESAERDNPPATLEEEPSAVEELHLDDSSPYGIITTQTCDLAEQGEPQQPWFQVSPVYRLEGTKEEQDRLASKQFIHELNGPLPEGRWVVDLRIEVPLEKSVLVGRVPVRGFASEEDADKFAHQLGRRRARAALANELVDEVIALLRARRGKRKGMWRTQIFRLMLEIEGGTRLAPAAVRLHVIANEEPTPDVQEFFDAWEDEARDPAHAVGIELWPTTYHDARSISLVEYDRWIELNLP